MIERPEAADGSVRETKIGELISKSKIEIDRLEDISQRIYALYTSLFGSGVSNEEESGPTTGPPSTMDFLMNMSDQKSRLIDDISNRLAYLENDLRP